MMPSGVMGPMGLTKMRTKTKTTMTMLTALIACADISGLTSHSLPLMPLLSSLVSSTRARSLTALMLSVAFQFTPKFPMSSFNPIASLRSKFTRMTSTRDPHSSVAEYQMSLPTLYDMPVSNNGAISAILM
eukprot:749850-Hanusia_phi.AAC.5